MRKEIIPIDRIARLVFVFREQKVMLDSDLASLYGVFTGHLNRAVKRNAGRFPCDFISNSTPKRCIL
jgi:ORF6N domain